MAQSYFAQQLSGQAVLELPSSMSREVGRIIIVWASFEHHVQDMVWQILGLSKAEGRIAVREPRVSDRLEMLNELIALHGTWDVKLYKSVLSRSRILLSRRDLLAHGMWGYFPQYDGWHVQLARGNWPKTYKDLISGSRRVRPEGMPLDLHELRSTTSQIHSLINDLKKLADTAYRKPIA